MTRGRSLSKRHALFGANLSLCANGLADHLFL